MQVLTASQVRQLQLTAVASYDALQVVEDFACQQVIDPVLVALTSKPAIAGYRMAYHTVMLIAAGAFYSGALARQGWDAFVRWADGYVVQCQQVSAPTIAEPMPEITLAELDAFDAQFSFLGELPPSPEPVLLLPPAKERQHNAVTAIANPILITPAPVQPAKRRGRPKGSKSKSKVA